MKTNPLAIFPYLFQNRYSESDIEVYDDKEKRLRYVFMDGKRLYFKRKWSKKEIKRRFNWLLIEQDIRSPHRYLTDRFRFEEGEVLIDDIPDIYLKGRAGEVLMKLEEFLT